MPDLPIDQSPSLPAFARTLLAVLLPSLALFFGLGQPWKGGAEVNVPSGTKTGPAVEERISLPDEHCRKRFSSLLRDYAGSDHPQAEPPLEETLQAFPGWLGRSPGAPATLEVIIATLPDPIDSGLTYQFDTQLQALRLGMEATAPGDDSSISGPLYRDRDWLPWDDRELEPNERRKSERCRRELPGAVLFRGAERDAPKLVVALIVGESPVSGVHPRAMRRALEIAHELQNVRRGVDRPIKILGPSFSGSAMSLRHAIETYRRPGHWERVRLVSGTATGPNVPRILGSDSRSGELKYNSTTIPEQAMECVFLYYTRRAGARAEGDARQAVLQGVAMLQESGTEFGAGLASTRPGHARASSPCPLGPELRLSFPFHISIIRNAYEKLDGRGGGSRQDAIARHTNLAISSQEAKRLDIETEISPITKNAQDLALGNLLGEISQGGIRWVGIQATDIADATFLARRIRDVAPDVRLAFFTADTLLLHPSFRRDLLGSLVVSPYPFLGTNDFVRSRRKSGHRDMVRAQLSSSFPNAEAEGTFNAARALRGVTVDQLTEYSFIGRARDQSPLPVWLAAIGRRGFNPVLVRPAVDCDGVIFGGKLAPPELCDRASSQWRRQKTWREFNALRGMELNVNPDVIPPRLWNFLFAALLVVAVLHALFHRTVRTELARGREPFPDTLQWLFGGMKDAGGGTPAYPTARFAGNRIEVNDSELDRCIVRGKWHVYALLAQTSLLLATFYMVSIYFLALATHARYATGLRLIVIIASSILALLLAIVRTWSDLKRVRTELTGFRDLLRTTERPLIGARGFPGLELTDNRPWSEQSWWARADSLLLWMGFASTGRDGRAIYVSYAQMRAVCFVSGMVVLLFFGGVVVSLLDGTEVILFGGTSVPARTLYILRTLPLADGVSPAAPLLASLACGYLWALGRMSRLRLIHSLSRMSPSDNVTDCVSTPIRAILYPDHTSTKPADQGFTRCERRLTNAIVRPNGLAYLGALTLIFFLPAVLFLLKRPSTLEAEDDTVLLFGSMWVCAVLACATLVQLVQYWRALDVVLERIAFHPLGQAFQRLRPPLRESVDSQVSRPPRDLAKIAACEEAHAVLEVGEWKLIQRSFQVIDEPAAPEQVQSARSQAMGETVVSPPPMQPVSSTQASETASARGAFPLDRRQSVDKLGELLVIEARRIFRLLNGVWSGALVGSAPLGTGDPAPDPSEARASLVAGDRLAVVRGALNDKEYEWLRAAEAFVASVVSLLVNKHVRQFRHFLYTTTGCTLLLLGAISSYPFEPHRTLLTCSWILTGAVVLTCLWVFVQLDRDPLLSSISGSSESAGKISWDKNFAYRIAVWVLLPLLGLLAAQYPAVANELTNVLEPFTRALW